jgi:hypothetical protein
MASSQLMWCAEQEVHCRHGTWSRQTRDAARLAGQTGTAAASRRCNVIGHATVPPTEMSPPAYQNPCPRPPSHARPVVPRSAGTRPRRNPYPGPPALGRPRRPAPTRPVFTDPSGHRARRMRLVGICAGGALVACLIVMTLGLLGAPGASFIPWRGHHGGGSAAAGVGRAGPAGPAPATMPAKPVSSGQSGGTRGGLSSPSASPSAVPSPSPAVTNRAGKKPPGRNRTPAPSSSAPSHGP